MSKLILIRHGQSIWNLENRFTGWADIPLSKKGLRDARKAGKLLENAQFHVAYTSELMRAQQTLLEILNANKNHNKFFRIHSAEKKDYNRFLRKHEDKMNYLKIFISPHINERDYGDLEGHNKDQMRKKFGKEQVEIWRRSYNVAPPHGESLKDTYERCIPYFKRTIEKDLREGKNVLVAAHGNSLRAIIKYLEKLSGKEIVQKEVPTGVPHIYYFNTKFEIIRKRVLKLSTKK